MYAGKKFSPLVEGRAQRSEFREFCALINPTCGPTGPQLIHDGLTET